MPAGAALRFTADAATSATLPGHYYHDEGIFAREAEEIFFKAWQFVGFAFDLESPGDYITAEILDQKVLVVRARDGRLRAYHNVCMHRGHVLAQGKGSKTVFTCPFHAWSYDTTGALRAAGNAENVAGFRLEDFHLSEVAVDTLGMLVFVNLDADAPALARWVPGLLEDWRAKVKLFDGMRLTHSRVYDIAANWKLIFDQNECYHCASVHPGFDTITDKPDEWVTVEHARWLTHLMRSSEAVRRARIAEARLRHAPEAWQDDIHIWQMWPNLLFISHQAPANFKIVHGLPAAADRTREVVYCLTRNDPPTADDDDYNRTFTDEINLQDIAPMEKQQAGLRSRGYRMGRLMVDAERSWISEHATHWSNRLAWEALNGPPA
ncbi:MAG: aromatic ring-hydroxylating dioxygenase subunit alpha [Alphaproteobacteria bacterium]|nr:aromatic ring-hydroxylating dioxygenase subunit alpha [Alphaproteobacteria bacterium]